MNLIYKLLKLAQFLDDSNLGIEAEQVGSIISDLEPPKPEVQTGDVTISENAPLGDNRIIKRGDKGPLVEMVQKMLEQHGYFLDRFGVDGDFGGETESAVFEFQRNNKDLGPQETGEVDEVTLAALKNPAAKKRFERAAQEGQPEKVTAGRDALSGMSEKTRERLYKLTQAEVGGQGAEAQQAFMETVSNRSVIQGRSINYTVSDGRYYEPIMKIRGKSVDNLRSVSESTTRKYDAILSKVIAGSNITNGGTHNASAGVARKVNKGGYNSTTSTVIVIGGETFYSKTYEQKKLRNLGIRN
tara:strand:+ start:539 stop:1438 length:900 start_codon:yes stop_codon:yes gene_type:complete